MGNKYCLGKVCKKETRDKISKANKGRKISDETRKKLREANLGKYCGKNSPSYGLVRSLETKRKISEKCKGLFIGEKSYRYDYNIYHFMNKITNEEFAGTRWEFYNKYDNISKSLISMVINGKRKTHKGWFLKS